MSRNLEGQKYNSSYLYNKEHVFEEICELYQIACLERGYSPITFVKQKTADNSDYGLCEAIIAEAKRIANAGGGHIKFSSLADIKEVKKGGGGYSYRVYPIRAEPDVNYNISFSNNSLSSTYNGCG